MTRKAVQQSKQVLPPRTGRTWSRFSQVLTIIKIACAPRRHPTEVFLRHGLKEAFEFEQRKGLPTPVRVAKQATRSARTSERFHAVDHRVIRVRIPKGRFFPFRFPEWFSDMFLMANK